MSCRELLVADVSDVKLTGIRGRINMIEEKIYHDYLEKIKTSDHNPEHP